MNLDLWMHQNTLVWSRLQVLWFVQVGFLGLSTYLSKSSSLGPSVDLSHLAKYVALLGAVTTFGLWIVMRTDRIIRSIYRRKVEACRLDFFPGSYWQKPFCEDKGTRYLEPVFHVIIFGVFVGIDLYTSWVFGIWSEVLRLWSWVLSLFHFT